MTPANPGGNPQEPASQARSQGLEETMTTIAEFIKMESLTMEANRAFSNPSMEDAFDGARHYEIKITANFGTIICHYSVGSGIIEQFLTNKYPKANLKVMDYTTIHDKEFTDQHSNEYRPSLVDVLDCLAMDVTDEDFDNWCDNYGFDQDSRKAERTYQTIQKQTAQLRLALGLEAYRRLVEEIERL